MVQVASAADADADVRRALGTTYADPGTGRVAVDVRLRQRPGVGLQGAPELTGLVPDRSLVAVPFAVSVKSATVLVPPLSFTTILRRCSLGAMSSLVIVQVANPPIPTAMFDPLWVPPTQIQLPRCTPAGSTQTTTRCRPEGRGPSRPESRPTDRWCLCRWR